MGSSQQVWVLEAVVQLDCEVAKLLAHLDVLHASQGQAVIDSLRSLRPGLIAAVTEARRRVLTSIDETTIHDAEAVLFARGALVMAQLAELRAAEGEVPVLRADGQRLQTVRDLSRHLADLIGRVNAKLLHERRELQTRAQEKGAHEALYHVALDSAEHELTSIGRDPDVARFLRRGAVSDSPRFRIACRTIELALDVVPRVDYPRAMWASVGNAAATDRAARPESER